MAHRAALYTVRVKVKYHDEYRPLGDIDDAGRRLDDTLLHFLTDNFEVESTDGEKILRGLRAEPDGGDVLVTLQHGQSGVAADIVNEDGAHQFRRTWTDTELVRCYSLFRLPAAQETGWLVTHVNSGRGVKGLLEVGLYRRFHADLSELKLELKPFIHGATMQTAIEQNRVDKIRLIKYEEPHDRALAATNKWVRAGQLGKIELDVSARGRGQRLLPGLLQDYVMGQADVFDSIVEFEGITFDEAKVEVVLPDNTRRTFNIEKPEAGHPMTMDIEGLDFDDDGEPTDESVFAGLRSALQALG